MGAASTPPGALRRPRWPGPRPPTGFVDAAEARDAGRRSCRCTSRYGAAVTDAACSLPATVGDEFGALDARAREGRLAIALRATIGDQQLITLVLDHRPGRAHHHDHDRRPGHHHNRRLSPGIAATGGCAVDQGGRRPAPASAGRPYRPSPPSARPPAIPRPDACVRARSLPPCTEAAMKPALKESPARRRRPHRPGAAPPSPGVRIGPAPTPLGRRRSRRRSHRERRGPPRAPAGWPSGRTEAVRHGDRTQPGQAGLGRANERRPIDGDQPKVGR